MWMISVNNNNYNNNKQNSYKKQNTYRKRKQAIILIHYI